MASLKKSIIMISSKILACLVCLMIVGAFHIIEIKPAKAITYPTVTVTIEGIQAIDDFGFLDTPEWYYYIGFRDIDTTSYSWIRGPSSGTYPDDSYIGVSHNFIGETPTIYFSIYACDEDLINDDLADISSDSYGGVDDVDCNPPIDGTWGGAYVGEWNFPTATLTGDTTMTEPEGIRTSGNFDGSTGIDENDANLWFTISDNYGLPTADAGSNQSGYVGDYISFSGAGSTASPGSSLEWYEWDFDDDGIYDSVGVFTSNRFYSKGLHTVKLRVTDSLGQTDIDTVTVTILNKDPEAAFTYSPPNPTTQDTINFTSESADPDGTISSWSWDFGDGETSTDENPTHQYADDGAYTASLTVTDNDGDTDTEITQIFIANVPPAAEFSFSPSSPSKSQTVDFTDASTDIDGEISSWSWNFGDGSSSTDQNPSHEYSSSGTFNVTLTVTDDDDDVDSVSYFITVPDNEVPTASFSIDVQNPTINHEIKFTDSSSDPDGSISQYEWDFGDGSTSNEKNPTHKYAEPGKYTASLTVTDNDGATDTFTMKIEVSPPVGVPSGGVRVDSLLWILIAIVVIIILLLAIILWRRRRKTTEIIQPQETE